MKRRRLLALGGLGILTGLSGCAVGRGRVCLRRHVESFGSPDIPAVMTVETENWDTGLLYTFNHSDSHAVVITSVAEAKRNLRAYRPGYFGDEGPLTFIEQTNFDDSYLIVAEWFGSSSSDDLELSSLERREYSIQVTAEVIEPCGRRTSDLSPHSLFIRVTDEQENAPKEATVHVNE